MKSFSPSEAAFEGLRLIKARPVSVFAWGLVYVAIFALLAALVWVLMGPQLQQAMVDGFKTAGANASGSRFNFSSGSGPIAILIDCAIFRSLLRPAQRSFASLRISGDELRVFLVALVLGVIMVLAIVVLAIAAAIPLILLFNSAVAGAHVLSVLTGVLIGLGALAILLWAGVRLCLASVITFAEKRIAIFDSWKLTRGNFWNLVGAFLLAWLLSILVMFGILVLAALICLAILSPVLGTLFSGSPDYGRAAPFIIGAGVVGVVALIFLAAIERVIMVAPLAYVYRALKAETAGLVEGERSPPPPYTGGALVL
jgi:hypothetical protein